MKLAVGFLTYNEASAKYLADFLPSLEKALAFLNQDDFKVFAYDNSDPANLINKEIISEFNLVHSNLIDYSSSGENLGFGRAYNILINWAISLRADYFLVINPDIILEPNALRSLTISLDENKDLAAVSPKIYYWDYQNKKKTNIIDSLGIMVKPGLRFFDLGQGTLDNGQFANLDYKIIGPSGATGLFRLSALEKIAYLDKNGNKQYFDERFFMYKEDCDLAYRLYLTGLKSKIISQAIFYHDRTSGSDEQNFLQKIINRSGKSRQVRAWSLRNQNIIYQKYWKKQNFVNKILIIFWFCASFIFSLILEQFNLKVYFYKN